MAHATWDSLNVPGDGQTKALRTNRCDHGANGSHLKSARTCGARFETSKMPASVVVVGENIGQFCAAREDFCLCLHCTTKGVGGRRAEARRKKVGSYTTDSPVPPHRAARCVLSTKRVKHEAC